MARLSFITREKNGISLGQRAKILLRLTHLQKVAYIDTGLTVGTSMERGKVAVNLVKGIVTAKEPGYSTMNTDLTKMLHRAERTLASLKNPNCFTIDELVQILKAGDIGCIGHTITEVANDYISRLREEHRHSYADMMHVSLKDWLELFGNTRVENIAPTMVVRWREWLRQITKSGKTLSEATINKKLQHLKTFLSHAKSRGIVLEMNPFCGVKIPRSDADYSVVDSETFKRWMSLVLPPGSRRVVHDMWMLTFYLCGANFCDIYNADLSGELFSFSRQKIRSVVHKRTVTHIPIIPQAREIIDKYIGDDGKLHFHFRQTDAKDVVHTLAHTLRKMREEYRLPDSFKLSTARDTFAQYCMELLIPDTVTDYLLGHSANKRGVMSYYSKLPPKIAEKYLTRVVDYAFHPEKYEDFIEEQMFRQVL